MRGIYVITAAGLVPGRTHQDVARAAVEAGARVVQFRQKTGSTRELLALAQDLREITRGSATHLVINDRVDVAMAVGASGVHLGDQDMPVRVARRLLGPEVLLGASVASEEEVREAEAAGADYLGVGPIYPTGTKADAGDAVGLEQIRRFRAITSLPIVAIGGITAAAAAEVAAAGADMVAVISAVAAAQDMAAAVRELRAAFERGQARA